MKTYTLFFILILTQLLLAYTDSNGNVRRNVTVAIPQALTAEQYPVICSGDDSVNVTSNFTDSTNTKLEYNITLNNYIGVGGKIAGIYKVSLGTETYSQSNLEVLKLRAVTKIQKSDKLITSITLADNDFHLHCILKKNRYNYFTKITPIYGDIQRGYNATMDEIWLGKIYLYKGFQMRFYLDKVSDYAICNTEYLLTIFYMD